MGGNIRGRGATTFETGGLPPHTHFLAVFVEK